MLHMLQSVAVEFQGFPNRHGGSMQHECDMDSQFTDSTSGYRWGWGSLVIRWIDRLNEPPLYNPVCFRLLQVSINEGVRLQCIPKTMTISPTSCTMRRR